MRFLADESLEQAVIARLREEGHEVAAVSEDRPGSEDVAVLARSTRERRILITNDKDFAELVFLQRQATAGIVLLRLPRLRSRSKAKRLLEVIGQRGQRLANVMTVVEEHAFRRRPFPRRHQHGSRG